MTTNYSAANLQWLGIAKETTPGTAAAAPTAFIPVISPKLTPKVNVLMDAGLRGTMAKDLGAQQGMTYYELTYQTYGYMDSLYQHLMAALGNPDTVTGSADPYTHKTALLNASQPPSYTIWMADGTGNAKRVVGCKSSNFAIDVKADALAQVDAGWTGISATDVTPPTNTPTTNQPMPSWMSTVTVAGTQLTKYSDVKITIKRSTEPIPVVNGTKAPLAIFAGELEVTADLTGIYQGSADNDIAAYLATSIASLVVTLAPAGDTHSLTLQMTKVVYSDASFSGTNKWMEVSAKATALGNATDALDANLSPVQAVFTTAVSTAY